MIIDTTCSVVERKMKEPNLEFHVDDFSVKVPDGSVIWVEHNNIPSGWENIVAIHSTPNMPSATVYWTMSAATSNYVTYTMHMEDQCQYSI